MGEYKNIIVAVDLSPDVDDELIRIALEVTKNANISISLVHSIEHIGAYGGTYGITIDSEIEEMLFKSAEKEMQRLADKIGISKDRQIIKFGSAKLLILEEADRQKADLIVVGSHGRHGIQLLLGSTANAVLHGAKCDVLAVRIKK